MARSSIITKAYPTRYTLAMLPLAEAERRAMVHSAMEEAEQRNLLANPQYAIFKRRYYYDWAGFATYCIDWTNSQGNIEYPADYQLEALDQFNSGTIFDWSLVANQEITQSELLALPMSEFGHQTTSKYSIRGLHGLGKTSLAAWLFWAFTLTTDGITDWKVLTTASRYFQLKTYLWPELEKWRKKIKWDVIGRPELAKGKDFYPVGMKMELQTGEASSTSPAKAEEMEGAHAGRLLALVDEAKLVVKPFFDALEGAASTAGKDTNDEMYQFAISTPGEPRGVFYGIHKRDKRYISWKVRHVTLAEAIAADRVSAEWAEERKQEWGESSAIYQNKVLGQFAIADEDAVIPIAHVEIAMLNWEKWQEGIRNSNSTLGTLTSVGGDVSEGGMVNDACSIAPIYDHVKVDTIREVARFNNDQSTIDMSVAIAGIIRGGGNKKAQAIIDAVGVGLGTLHNLRSEGFYARGFKSGRKTTMMDQTGELYFYNWRCAVWWFAREALNPKSGMNVCLPPDDNDRLISELTAPKWKRRPPNHIWVESKDEIRDRLEDNSTDYADAVLYGLFGPLLCDEFDNEKGHIEVSMI